MPSPELQEIIDSLRERVVPADITWEERRRGMEEMQAELELPADAGYEPAEANGVPVEWISAPASEADKTVLYLHGGGYTIGSIATIDT